ncbi:winged helix-turn-helix transcriptional regulator [Chelatococcus daeguensis]|uniref:ArsR/SmtB family transcription factor n=1 Tax=Chelatococcus daeguensis TaxID=444444 RepID=UPI0007ABF462|nr:metalloregulator ArsR/SmtB family transcription factor [Chelatococcus daeguensis]KZE34511.1 ArsR family transcriptional regulator [Chelatococcus daeguensis]MBM3083066.1 winged helix-turn-helix transcriptional regulator [Chelatococcus daeguensis]
MENNSDRLDHAFAALSDPTRRAIVARLAQGEASVGDLAEPFAIGLPTMLKHIRALERGGLIVSTKTGRVRRCALVPDALRQTEAWLRTHIAAWEGRLDRLEAHLTRMKKDQGNDR